MILSWHPNSILLTFSSPLLSGLTIAVYVGMLVGALFWGFGADIIGRKWAFNTSLIICSLFAIIAGGSPNWIVLGLFVCLSAFGGGGNLVLDTAVFLEYLPGRYQWLITLMACFWGIGQLIAGLFAWAFIPNFSCSTAATCTRSNNMGWRYIWFASGALVFIMSILRITVIRLKETPKYLVGEGKDAEVIESIQSIATKYNRPCSLTLEKLQACGVIGDSGARRGSITHAKQRYSLGEISVHLRGLYATKRIGLSTTLIWFSWTLIGLAYPLYNVFLPTYLKTRGAQFGVTSQYITWRNYCLANLCSIFGKLYTTILGQQSSANLIVNVRACSRWLYGMVALL
jgi:MFS family permease